MAALVTIDEVTSQLMLDTDAANAWIEMMIPAISGAVVTWLKDEWRCYVPLEDSNGDPIEDSSGATIPAIDSNGDPITLPHVKAATLVEIASQFRFRDGVGAAAVPSNWGHGYVLSLGATALLAGTRKSTVK